MHYAMLLITFFNVTSIFTYKRVVVIVLLTDTRHVSNAQHQQV